MFHHHRTVSEWFLYLAALSPLTTCRFRRCTLAVGAGARSSWLTSTSFDFSRGAFTIIAARARPTRFATTPTSNNRSNFRALTIRAAGTISSRLAFAGGGTRTVIPARTHPSAFATAILGWKIMQTFNKKPIWILWIVHKVSHK